MRHTLNQRHVSVRLSFYRHNNTPDLPGQVFRRRMYGDAPENNVKGLSEAEVQTRLAQYGYNEVREQPPGQLRAVLKRLWGPIPGCSKLRWYSKWLWGRRLNPSSLLDGLLSVRSLAAFRNDARSQHLTSCVTD
jgi:hypothetical protein